jgi:hypothetical protein
LGVSCVRLTPPPPPPPPHSSAMLHCYTAVAAATAKAPGQLKALLLLGTAAGQDPSGVPGPPPRGRCARSRMRTPTRLHA